MLTGANEDLTSEEVIDALLHALKGVLQRHSWVPAFSKKQFGPALRITSAFVGGTSMAHAASH